MGQIEIYELLKQRRLYGDTDFHTVRQIKKMLRDEGNVANCNTALQTAQLEAFGYLEAKRVRKKSDHWRAFRIKIEYID